MRNRSAFSVLDLLVVLALLSVIASVTVPRLVNARNAYAARAARDAAAAWVERARSLASSRGTARLTVDIAQGELRMEAPVGVTVGMPLAVQSAFGVRMSVDGTSSGTVHLDFNAVGLGVLANRTLRFRRGDEEARLSLSTYGRARRW
jgi:hypothetical protein